MEVATNLTPGVPQMLENQTVTVNQTERDQMICSHLPLASYVVRKMLIEMPGGVVDYEDLVGYGTVGLIQAIDRFDPALGIPFAAFAIPRIRGAILDALRKLDPLSRQQRSMAKQITVKQNELAMTLGREATERELREATGLEHQQFNSTRSLAGFRCVPIADSNEEGFLFGYPEPADPDEPPTAGIERQELLASLAQAVKLLPERERLIVALHYDERLTYREIATMMKVSETRIAQLMRQALNRLRRNPQLAAAA